MKRKTPDSEEAGEEMNGSASKKLRTEERPFAELKRARYDYGMSWCVFQLETPDAIACFRFHFEKHPFSELRQWIESTCPLTTEPLLQGRFMQEIFELPSSMAPLDEFLQHTMGRDMKHHGVRLYKRVQRPPRGAFLCQVFVQPGSSRKHHVLATDTLEDVQQFVIKELCCRETFSYGQQVSFQFVLEDLYVSPPINLVPLVQLISAVDGKLHQLQSPVLGGGRSLWSLLGHDDEKADGYETELWFEENDPIWSPHRLSQFRTVLGFLLTELPGPLVRVIGHYAGPQLVLDINLMRDLPNMVPRHLLLDKEDETVLLSRLRYDQSFDAFDPFGRLRHQNLMVCPLEDGHRQELMSEMDKWRESRRKPGAEHEGHHIQSMDLATHIIPLVRGVNDWE